VGEVSKASEVVDGERDEDDTLVVPLLDDPRTLSLMVYVLCLKTSCVSRHHANSGTNYVVDSLRHKKSKVKSGFCCVATGQK
jgi:hypothetical protein